MGDLTFIQGLAASQRQLYRYITSRVPSPSDADDVLQETNLVLWRKAADFQPGTRFTTWAFRVASYEVLQFYRRRRRSPVRVGDEAFRGCLRHEPWDHGFDEERVCALRRCLSRLGERDRNLLHRFYFDEWSQREIARERGQSEQTIRVTMHRIRVSLLESINRVISRDAWPTAK